MKVKENDTIKCESLLIIYDSSVEDDDNFRTLHLLFYALPLIVFIIQHLFETTLKMSDKKD